MAKKKRKPPAKAPVIRHRVPSEAPYDDEDPQRPDPDQPPFEGAAARPSIYSEWLNSPSERPSVFSQWLNLPVPPASAPAAPPQAVRPTAQIPIADPTERRAPGASLRDADEAGERAAAARSEATTVQARRRKTSAARRLSPAERLNVDVDTLAARSSPARPAASAGAPNAGNRVRPTQALPAIPAEQLAPSRRPTPARLPSTLGETTTRIPVPGRGTAGPTPRRGTAGPAPIPRGATAGRAPLAPPATAERLPLDRRATAAQMPTTRRATAADLPAARRTGGAPARGYTPPDSGLLIRGARHPRLAISIVPRRLRPPSAVMQLIVALVTVFTLLGALTVISPLGYGAAISGTIQAYANSVMVAPTPTPTATPIPQSSGSAPPSPGQQVVISTIQAVFGQYAAGALNVARCESGYDPSARNPYPVGNSHAEGVFQILYPSTWDTTSYAAQSPYDYNANIHAAWQIFSRDGYSWREWACQP